jgi:hypothetical protein
MIAQSDTRRKKITPPELARQWGIDPHKVIAWVRSGELRAIDVATHRGGRPRYLIDLADVAAFEEARLVAPPTRVLRRRRTVRPKEYIEYV